MKITVRILSCLFVAISIHIALALRKATGCYRTQLTEVREFVHMPEVEKLVIQQLDDPAPSVARDAAQALQRYGSSEAENALWARLEKFHQQWKDKPDELLHPQPNTTVFDSESGLEQVLVQGILLGQVWFADAATIRRLKELTSPTRQNELDGTLQMLRGGEFTLDMGWWPEDELNFKLAPWPNTYIVPRSIAHAVRCKSPQRLVSEDLRGSVANPWNMREYSCVCNVWSPMVANHL